MSRFKIGDLSTLEKSPPLPHPAQQDGECFQFDPGGGLGEIVNKETGETEVVLQGTLDTEEAGLRALVRYRDHPREGPVMEP